MTSIREGTDPTPPPYDVELAAALTLEGPSCDDLIFTDLSRLRQLSPSPSVADLLQGRPIVHQEHDVPSRFDGAPIRLSVFRPAASQPGPGMLFTHGGGLILGDRLSDADVFLDLVETFGVTVVSVEYRLAPEHPHPVPAEDAYSALEWTADHAADLGVDARQLLVGGVSGGAGLAAALALMARDRSGPELIGQLLISPMLDDRDHTVSARQYPSGPWNRQHSRAAWSALLGAAVGGAEVSPYAAPARATDLGGLPPAYLEVGSAEIFRDEVVDYAARIWAAGGQAGLHVWAGGFHCFWRVPYASLTHAALAARNAWLGRITGIGVETDARRRG